MKKFFSVLLILVMIFSLSSCIVNNGGFRVQENDGVTIIELSKFMGDNIFEIPHSEEDGDTIYYIADVSDGAMAYCVSGSKGMFPSYSLDIVDTESEDEIRMFHVDSGADIVYVIVESASVSGSIKLSYTKEALEE